MDKTVIIIDDDKNIAKIASIALSRIGKWQVIVANSSQTGLNLCIEHKPDCVLLDIMMPNMSGLELFQALKADDICSNIPVIFMTAKVQKHEISNYLTLGVKGVITKPFDPLKLNNQVLDILNLNAVKI